MAITWDVGISDVRVDKGWADVVFRRTDDVTGDTEVYRYDQIKIETAQQRSDLLDTVWAKHLVAVGERSAVDAFVTNLEQLAKSNLEAREA